MSFSSEALYRALGALSQEAQAPKRFLLAFSGGLDSTVLLHALQAGLASHDVPLLAVHIDHGMQAGSTSWTAHCQDVASALGVDFHSERVTVDMQAGKGPEAAARYARYAALAELMSAGDWLLTAHHQEDQAETLLLNLLRGGGPAGLAGIASLRPFATGWLARPLLAFSQRTLRDYANQHDLEWIDDPSNSDRSLDRNFLRHEVIPIVETRWPGAAERLCRSSRIAADAAAMLDDVAAQDLTLLGGCCDRMPLDVLQQLPQRRQRNVLRYALRELGLAVPSASHLQRLIDEVVLAREDANPQLKWGDVEIRRFRNCLYLLRRSDPVDVAKAAAFGASDVHELGAGLGVLRLEYGAAQGLDGQLLERGLELRFRQGGEKIKPLNQSCTKTLKNLLHEERVVPWMRDRVPLLFAGEKLVAVADICLAEDAVSTPGVAIHWENRPPIH